MRRDSNGELDGRYDAYLYRSGYLYHHAELERSDEMDLSEWIKTPRTQSRDDSE